MTGERCADLSELAGEPISATATYAENWLLLEVRGTWPRDVSDLTGLDDPAREAITSWLEETPASKLLFIRRPGGNRGELQRAFVVRAAEREVAVRRFDFDDFAALAGADLANGGVALDSQLVLVCAHGTRDACCALRGSAVFGVLEGHVAPDDLWLSSHQGGHRFAANVLVLPGGIQLGRLSAANAAEVVTAALDGRISLAHYRGRTSYPARVQAAERAIRESRHLTGAGDLELVEDDGSSVRFVDADGTEHAAVPEDTAGPSVPASCGAEPEPQKHLAARLA